MCDSDLEHPSRRLDLDYYVWQWPGTPQQVAWFGLLCVTVTWNTPAGGLIWITMCDSDLEHPSRRLDLDYYVWQWPETPQPAAWFRLLCSDLTHPSRWLDSDYCECLEVRWKTLAGGLISIIVYVWQWPETPQQAAWFGLLCMSDSDLKHRNRRLDFDYYVWQRPRRPQQVDLFGLLCMSDSDLKHHNRRLYLDYCVCLTVTWNTTALMQDKTHPRNICFQHLPTDRRLKVPMAKKHVYKKSFIPTAV